MGVSREVRSGGRGPQQMWVLDQARDEGQGGKDQTGHRQGKPGPGGATGHWLGKNVARTSHTEMEVSA